MERGYKFFGYMLLVPANHMAANCYEFSAL